MLSDFQALNDYAHYFDKYKEPLLCPVKMSIDGHVEGRSRENKRLQDPMNRLLDLSKVLAIV